MTLYVARETELARNVSTSFKVALLANGNEKLTGKYATGKKSKARAADINGLKIEPQNKESISLKKTVIAVIRTDLLQVRDNKNAA